jgi:hypothetical protein
MNKEFDIPTAELESLAQVMDKTFILRRDLYSRQLDDGSYVCIQKPLKPGHLIAHLKGDLTLGAYVLDAESKTRYIVFDADDESQFASLVNMAERLNPQGATAYLEQSRRGGHLWLFFSMQTKGKVARELGKGLSLVYGLEGIELFPKQDRLTSGPGSLVRLPFGIHRKAGQRYGFITPDGNPLAATLAEQVHILAQPKTVPASVFQAYRSLQPTSSPKAENTEFVTTDVPTGTLSERIKGSITVLDFVSKYVELSPTGRGLCPFHDDQQNSFAVNAEKNYWYCFAGCGGGSIIDFWMKKQDCDFKQALKELAGMLLT